MTGDRGGAAAVWDACPYTAGRTVVGHQAATERPDAHRTDINVDMTS